MSNVTYIKGKLVSSVETTRYVKISDNGLMRILEKHIKDNHSLHGDIKYAEFLNEDGVALEAPSVIRVALE